MGAFSKGLIYIFKDFSCWASIHGVSHIGMANAFWLRIFWILVVCGCIVGFLQQLQVLIMKYLSYNVNSETKLEFAERKFPAVTICHMNPWKRDSLHDTRYITEMINAYTNPTADPRFGFAQGLDSSRQQKAVKLTSLANKHLFSLMTTPGAESPAYSFSDLLISCSYSAKACEDSYWKSVEDPDFGLCQVFNFDEQLKSSRAGPLYGLRAFIRTNQDNFLPWTEAAGVVVSIHNKTDASFPDLLGYYAGPGLATSMGVRYTQQTRKEAPYGDCTTATTADQVHYKGKYEAESCFRSCLQVEIIKKCNCYDPTYDFIGSGTPSCFVEGDTDADYTQTAVNMQCIEDLQNPEKSTFSIIKDCQECYQPCSVQTYSVTVSTATWPSNEYKPQECIAKNHTGQPWYGPTTTDDNKRQQCLDWYNINTLLVEIYYERMNYQVLTESPAYTIVNLISDIGGQVGLFLGMSIISVIEFLTLIFLLFYYCFTHKSRRIELEGIEKTAEQQKRDTEAMQQRMAEKKARSAEDKRRRLQANLDKHEGAESGHDGNPPKSNGTTDNSDFSEDDAIYERGHHDVHSVPKIQD